jgi:hypothetical protein
MRHDGEDMSTLHLLKMGDKLHIISGSRRISVHMGVERMTASPCTLDIVALHKIVLSVLCLVFSFMH